jgi:hypothetical protein
MVRSIARGRTPTSAPPDFFGINKSLLAQDFSSAATQSRCQSATWRQGTHIKTAPFCHAEAAIGREALDG